MTTHQSNAFLLSATLHGVVIAAVLSITYTVHRQTKTPEKVFELVAGAGDNFGATAAPAGTGRSAPRQRTMAQEIRRQLANAELRAKNQAAREREAEVKRLAQLEAEQKKQGASAPARAPGQSARNEPTSFKKIDAEGIVDGVLGGATSVKEGAGGTALVRSEGTELEAYFAMLKSRLLEAIDKPSGVSDTLVTEVEFRLNADGSIANVRISKRSGSAEFDRAVLAAFARTRMPPRPDGRSETHTLAFRTRDVEAR